MCGNSASTDLCGGPAERPVPTATLFETCALEPQTLKSPSLSPVPKKPRSSRRKFVFPDFLPVVRHEHSLEPGERACGGCGCERTAIQTRVTQQIEIERRQSLHRRAFARHLRLPKMPQRQPIADHIEASHAAGKESLRRECTRLDHLREVRAAFTDLSSSGDAATPAGHLAFTTAAGESPARLRSGAPPSGGEWTARSCCAAA